MNGEIRLSLTDAEWDRVSELIALCNEADGTGYDTEPEGDFYYLIENEEPEESGVEEPILSVLFGYRIGEREAGQEVLELMAFTHPKMRELGYFRENLRALQDDFREFRFHFLVKPVQERVGETEEEASGEKEVLPEGTRAAISALSMEYLGSELFLARSLPHGIENPGDGLSNQFGEVHLTPYSADTLYLYGLLVYDRYLGQGHGRALMEAVEQYEEGPYQRILLQVSRENEIAYGLYRRMGYQLRDQTISYGLPR